MQLNNLSMTFGSKYNPKVNQPTNLIISDPKHLQMISTKKDNHIPSAMMVKAYQAQTLTETTNSVLNKLVDSAVSGEAKNWSYVSKPEGGSVLSAQLNGKQYLLESTKTNETYEKDGEKYYKLDFALTVKTPGTEDKVYKLSGDEYKSAAEKIETVVFPEIEKQYGLGNGLDLTNVITELAKNTVDGKIQWEQVDASIGFGNGLSIEASGAVAGVMPDGTKVHVLEKVVNQIFSITRTSFISLEKPGLPPQVIMVGSDQEEKAYELFGGAFKLIEKEKELKQALEEINQNKVTLKQMIEEFIKPKEA